VRLLNTIEANFRGRRLMKISQQLLKKAYNMSSYLVIISHCAFSFVVLSTLYDVFLRYFFGKPILGVIELNQCMMPIMVFMAVGLTQRYQGHVKVTIIVNRLKENHQIFFELTAYAFAIVFTALFGWETWLDAIKALRENESVLVGINVMPIWWAKFSIPIGFWALSLQCLVDLVGRIQSIKNSGNSQARLGKGEILK
jgi:TRAP-type C4-dicarboxylate transport system permease small subunit